MPLRIVPDGDAALVTNCEEESSVWRVGAGPPQEIASELSFPVEIARGGGALYVTCLGEDRDGGFVQRISPSEVRRVANGLTGPTGIAADGDLLVLDRAARLLRIDERTGAVSIVASPEESLVEEVLYGRKPPPRGLRSLGPGVPATFGLASSGATVFWVGLDGSLRSFPPQQPSAPEQETDPASLRGTDIAIAGAHVYIAKRGGAHMERRSQSGDSAAAFVDADGAVQAIATDGRRLFWTTAGSEDRPGRLYVHPLAR